MRRYNNFKCGGGIWWLLESSFIFIISCIFSWHRAMKHPANVKIYHEIQKGICIKLFKIVMTFGTFLFACVSRSSSWLESCKYKNRPGIQGRLKMESVVILYFLFKSILPSSQSVSLSNSERRFKSKHSYAGAIKKAWIFKVFLTDTLYFFSLFQKHK